MLFNSYPFFFLVLITFVFYYSKAFKNYQVYLLIFSSAVFYGYSQPYLLILLYSSATINAITSYLIFHDEKLKRKRWVAIVGVVFNLLVLAFFKYNKLLDGYMAGPGTEVDQLLAFVVSLPLPIGISFYTFQGISLVMDIYKPLKKYNISVDENFWIHYKNTLFFISFFPQLVAGPIVKAHDFFPQIIRKHTRNIDYVYVFRTLVVGYFLKSVVADNLKDQTFWISAPYFESQSSVTLIAMLFGYSMQIFADFAGYSLIAIGVAALFGYKLPQNFNYPYISQSITEFWRRWHISLSSWLKEYLYISFLGGNKKGNIRTYVNLIIVMFLGGLWHGAAISYGIWGLWHGIGLAIERVLSREEGITKHPGIIRKIFRMLFIFLFVSFGWLLFKLTNILEAISYLVAIKDNINMRPDFLIILNIAIYSLPIIFYHLLYLAKSSDNKLSKIIYRHDYTIFAAMIILLLVNGGIPGEFIYFQF